MDEMKDRLGKREAPKIRSSGCTRFGKKDKDSKIRGLRKKQEKNPAPPRTVVGRFSRETD